MSASAAATLHGLVSLPLQQPNARLWSTSSTLLLACCCSSKRMQQKCTVA